MGENPARVEDGKEKKEKNVQPDPILPNTIFPILLPKYV
jgi:hypothetical protein